MTTSERGDQTMPTAGPRSSRSDTWIERVREADAEAERAYQQAEENRTHPQAQIPYALIAIAAELRAQRIARRPGAGQ